MGLDHNQHLILSSSVLLTGFHAAARLFHSESTKGSRFTKTLRNLPLEILGTKITEQTY